MAEKSLFRHFCFVDKMIFSELLQTTMYSYGCSLWVFLCSLMLKSFWFITKFIKRLKPDNQAKRDVANFDANHSQVDEQGGLTRLSDSESFVNEEKESLQFSFSFLSWESKGSDGNVAKSENEVVVHNGFSANTLKYQFVSGKDVCGFMEEPETMSFTLQEMFMNLNDHGLISGIEMLETGEPMIENEMNSQSDEKDSFHQLDLGWCHNHLIEELDFGEISRDQEKAELSAETLFAEDHGDVKTANSVENCAATDEEISYNGDSFPENDDISYELQFLPGKVFSASDLKTEFENFDDESYSKSHEIQLIEYQVSFDKLVKEISSSDPPVTANETKSEMVDVSPNLGEAHDDSLCLSREAHVNEDAAEEFCDDFIEMEPCSRDSTDVDREISLHTQGMKLMNDEVSGYIGEVSSRKESWELDSDDDEDEDEDEFYVLLEHQKLVQQMKIEMKNSKVIGLPTISEDEECVTPKIEEDFKPLQIEEKFEYKDCMEEIQSFYKSYAEKMRKLDILNYQSLHAINLIQRKGSQPVMADKSTGVSSIKNFPLLSFGLCRQRRIFADPTFKSISEMQRDQELVYVGQICLSWEILRWQYGKLQDLQYLSQVHHQSYNQIAGEYQQFQVLMQRFLEDEPFQGPRVQNYIKNRSFCRSLLQVPIIRADSSKNKKERMLEGEDNAISIAKLAETIKEAMQIFWDFLHADKHESNAILKGVQGSRPVRLQAPEDAELLINIRTLLEKKERKIKEIQRSRNCIVKKLKKHQPDGVRNALLISHVELKLVSRVVTLSRLRTEQLIWCQKKLNSINIVNKNIHVDPAFLLFPC